MSLVYITHHNENVLDYEKVGQVQASIKPMKYTSKHKRAVKKQINQPYVTHAVDGRLLLTDSGKHERRTMGCAKTPLNPPKLFLRKNEGIKWKRLHDHICPKPVDLPPVPKVSEMPPKPICPPSPPPKVKTPKSATTSAKQATKKEAQATVDDKSTSPMNQPPAPADTTNEQYEEKEFMTPFTPSTEVYKPVEESKSKPEITLPPCMIPQSGFLKDKTKDVIDCKVAPPCSSRPAAGGCPTEPCSKKSSSTKLKKCIEKKKPTKSIDPCRRINFIALNIKRMKSAQTKRPPPRYIDTPKGETHNLINSGLIPQHVCGRNFAKVPCYIREHKKLMQKYNETCAAELQTMQHCTEFMKKQGVRKMTLEERVALLEGLKANYMEQLKVFQTLSLYVDTPTKKLRKGRLEKDLDQLELDIKFIQDNLVIYVEE